MNHSNKNVQSKFNNKGFTLIEILIVMGIIGILATIVLVAVNPARQFAQSRDTQRVANVNALLNAVGERVADHRGLFEEGCPAGAVPTSTKAIKSTGGFDIYGCITPTYISALPLDPSKGSFVSATDYDSGYTIVQDSVTGRVTVSAPSTEIASGTISVTR